MEEIKFTIIRIGNDICRIKAKDIRSIYKNISDGGCITSVNVLLSQIEYISKKVEKLGDRVVFIYIQKKE